MKSLSTFQPYTFMYVDAMNLLSRCYYGMSMMEYKGKKTGMLLGVSRLLIDWRKRHHGIRVVFVWEGRDSWRKKEYPIYKAQRHVARAEQSLELKKTFFESLDHVKESLPFMGVDQVSAYTYEADDTVWSVMREDSGKKLFVSTDWDWWSLSEHGDILYENHVFTDKELQEKFIRKYKCGPIPMNRLWVFKALTGDPSDNVSGIPRFPKKIAAELASDCLLGAEDLIRGIHNHGYPSWAERTIAHRWILDRNLKLVRPAPPSPDSLEWVYSKPYDVKVFGAILLNHGMGVLHDKLIGGN